MESGLKWQTSTLRPSSQSMLSLAIKHMKSVGSHVLIIFPGCDAQNRDASVWAQQGDFQSHQDILGYPHEEMLQLCKHTGQQDKERWALDLAALLHS